MTILLRENVKMDKFGVSDCIIVFVFQRVAIRQSAACLINRRARERCHMAVTGESIKLTFAIIARQSEYC
jgi:hypothetical protein